MTLDRRPTPSFGHMIERRAIRQELINFFGVHQRYPSIILHLSTLMLINIAWGAKQVTPRPRASASWVPTAPMPRCVLAENCLIMALRDQDRPPLRCMSIDRSSLDPNSRHGLNIRLGNDREPAIFGYASFMRTA